MYLLKNAGVLMVDVAALFGNFSVECAAFFRLWRTLSVMPVCCSGEQFELSLVPRETGGSPQAGGGGEGCKDDMVG